MIKGTLFFAVLLAMSNLAAIAQSVDVRSGEHADFTRLVFNLPERMDVSLRYQTDSVELDFERGGLLFSTGRVFDRVPQTRLTSITQVDEASRVTLALACKCSVDTFWAGGSAFVVDIGDATEASVALFSEDRTPSRQESDGNATGQEGAAQSGVAFGTSPTGVNVGSIEFLIADAFERLPSVESIPTTGIAEHADRVKQSQDAIIEQLGRAASQGLLSPRDDLMPKAPGQTPSVAASVTSEVAPSATTSEINDATAMILKVQTSVDQAVAQQIRFSDQRDENFGCLQQSLVDVPAWAGDTGFVDQIGPLRSALIGEFDQPSDDAILNLTRFYIHFGFGAEAAQVMDLLPEGQTKTPILRAMTNILERGHDGQNSILADHMDCDPLVAAWSILSYEKVPGNQPIDPDAIVRGFLKFPLHLRAYLGPVIGEKLRLAGYPKPADQIARALLRNDETNSAAAEFLSAQGPSLGQRDAPTEDELQAVIAENGEPSADALLRLIEGRLNRDEGISEDMALLAGSYATELRDTPMGANMARAYVLAIATSGGFDQAFAELDRLRASKPIPRPGTMSDLMGVLTKTGSDTAFLTHSMQAEQSDRFALDDRVGNAVAARLLALGFAEAAARYVAPMAGEEAERARKLLRAEIALMQAKPRRAELELIGETGDDVTLLLARARDMVGEHSTSQEMYARIEQPEKAERQAWLERDWESLQNHSDPAIATVANRQMNDVAFEADVTEILARNTEMLQDSAAMRSELEALLSGITVPENGTNEEQ